MMSAVHGGHGGHVLAVDGPKCCVRHTHSRCQHHFGQWFNLDAVFNAVNGLLILAYAGTGISAA